MKFLPPPAPHIDLTKNEHLATHIFWSGMETAFILGFLGVVAIIVLCDLVKRARNK